VEHQLEENAMIQVNNTRFQFLFGENSINNILKIPENKNDPVNIVRQNLSTTYVCTGNENSKPI
jgi:hypothetical protein